MKTKLLRFAVVALTLGALARMGVTPSRAADGSSSGAGGGGCCGSQQDQPAPKTNCPSGLTYNSSSKMCVDSSGNPRADPF